MKMKWLIRSLSALGILLLFVVALLFTHAGNIILWKQTIHWLPQLQGELTEGHLGNGWSIENLAWNDAQVTFHADKVSINWRLSGLIHKHLSITQLDVLNPVIQLADSTDNESPATNEQTAETKTALPVTVNIDHISINGFKLDKPGLTIAFTHLNSNVQLGNNGLTISGSTLQQLTVTTSEVSGKQQKPNNNSNSKAEPIVLPAVKLPFPIQLAKLQLVNSSLNNETVPDITVALEGRQHKIDLKSISVIHPMANLHLSGSVNLLDNYPLGLTLDATLKKTLTSALPESQKVHAVLSGNLNQLNADITATGPVKATLIGSLAPLKKQLPFDLRLVWQPLQWPLAGNSSAVQLRQGKAKITGNLSHYTFSLNTNILAPNQPPAALAVTGAGDIRQLSLDEAVLTTNPGNAVIQGKLSWDKKLDWQGQLHLKAFNPSFWVPKLPGHINGVLTHHFYTTGKDWNLNISDATINGQLRNKPVKISGKIDGNSKMHWHFKHTNIAVGSNSISINGAFANTWDVKALLNGPDLSQLYPGLKGAIKGQVRLTGSQQTPSTTYDLASPEFSWRQYSLAGLKTSGKLNKGKEFNGAVKLEVQQLHSHTLALQNINVNAEGTESKHQLTLISSGTPVSANLNLTGVWKNKTWTGEVQQAQVKTQTGNWVLQNPLAILLDAQQTLSLKDQCWHSDKASFCMKPASIARNKAQVAFSLNNFDLKQLQPFYPEAFAWQADLSGQGQFKWLNNKPELTLKLSTTPGAIIARELNQNYESLGVQMDLNGQTMSAKLHFLSQGLGQADINLAVSDIQNKRQLNGQLAISDIMLSIFEPFIPEINQVKGTLSANGHLGGSLTAPLFFGDLMLNKGGLETMQDIVSINQLNSRMKINGSSGVITGQMTVGKGTLKLGGDIDWTTMPLSGQITLKGEGLEAQYPGFGKLRLSPNLTARLGMEQNITGKISIPWARIKIKKLPSGAVTRSGDVTIITPDQNMDAQKEQTTPVRANVQVVFGKDVELEAFGLETRIHGALDISQQPAIPLDIHGTIRLKEGKYRSLGQNLIIKEGTIIFSGPPENPYLVLKAIRDPDTIEESVTVGVLVNGPVAQPSWEIFSNPAMLQSEQFSYLLRGRAIKSDKKDSNALETMLLGLGINKLGGSKIGNLVTSIGESVGVHELSLDTAGSGDDTQVTVSGYIAPNIQVQYGIGVFNSVGEVKVKYELLPKLYLQAVSGLAQALDIFYRFTL